MFKLKELELIHWDYWSRVVVPMDANIITIVGPNGSGKTTLIDACRTLLAIECSKDRNYHRYVRNSKARTGWLRALVENPRNRTSGRSFFPVTSEVVTLVCRIRHSGGEWERKYAIIAGPTSIEAIDADRALSWIGVREYETRLRSAGISRAMRKVLALDQGETDKLCEYTGSELRRLVFDTFGDQSVMDEYQQALRDYEEARQELDAAELQVKREEVSVAQLQQRLKRLREWQALKQELLTLECEVLPVAEINDAWHSWQRLRRERQRSWRAVLQGRRDERRLLKALDEAGKAVAATTEGREQLDQAYEALRDAQQDRQGELENLRGLVAEREELAALAAQQQAGFDGAEVAAALAAWQARAADERAARKSQQESVEALSRQREALKAALGLHDEVVRRYVEALQAAGISHAVLSDRLSVTETRWQAAVEGLLGPHLGLVVLENAADRARALHLAAQCRYRRFITADANVAPEANATSLAARVGFAGAIPGWLFDWLNGVQRVASIEAGHRLSTNDVRAAWITPEGFYRDHRGARYVLATPEQFVLGEAARQARLLTVDEALASAQDGLASIDARISSLDAQIRQAERLLRGHDAAAELAARSQAFADAEQRLSVLDEEYRRLSEQQTALQRKRAEAIRREKEASRAHGRVEQDTESTRADTRRAFHQWQTAREADVVSHRALRDRLRQAPPNWCTAKARVAILERYGYLEMSVPQIKRELEQKQQKASTIPEEDRDESIELRCTKAEAELEEKRVSLRQREEMREQTLELVDAQRQRYINVLKASAAHYMRHVRTLARMAGIDAQTKPLYIENNDASIAQASLEIAFRFDDKHEADVLAGDSSGGQKVMKSMILLMALLMDEDRPAGVVFIDEPFAHLDIMNIDRVSRFLQQTQAQYIVTTPITHNANVYTPSQITLVTQKVRPGVRHAPPIGVAVRRKPEAIEASE